MFLWVRYHYADITELDSETLNRLIKEIIVHETIDEEKILNIVDYVIAKHHINSRFLKVECEFTFEFINL